MKDVIRKTAALILALAMIVTFTPLYGMGAIAYAEDEEVAADQNTVGEEDLAAGEELSGDEAGEEDQVSPDEENPVVEEPVVEDEGDPEEDVVEETAGEEEHPFIAKGIKKAPVSIDKGGGDGTRSWDGEIASFNLEGPWAIFTDGEATYRLTDGAALNVDGVTHYGAFVGIPGEWTELNEDCYGYDEATQTITVDGRVIAEKHPDYVVDKKLSIQIKGMGDEPTEENPEDIRMLATTEEFVYIWNPYSEYRWPENRTILPGWEGTINGSIDYYEENSNYPEGRDVRLNVDSIEITEGENLIKMKYDSDEDEGSHWWYYRAGNRIGNVTFTLTYTDIDNIQKTRDVHLTIGGDTYEADVYAEGDVHTLLPGQELTLHAWGMHKYLHGDNEMWEEYDKDTPGGLDFVWELERNDKDIAALEVDENDHSTATLKIRDLNEGEEGIEAGVEVKVKLVNSDDEEDPDGEKASNNYGLGVYDDYYDIRPLWIDHNLGVGQSTGLLEFTVHHFTYDAGEMQDDTVEIKRAKWDFDSEGLEILKDGETATPVISEQEFSDTNSFIIKKLVARGMGSQLTLWFDDVKSGKERNVRAGYWFNDNDYHLWFDNHDIDIYSDTDEDPQLRLNTGAFGQGAEADENFDFTIEAAIDRGRDWDEVISADKISTERDGDELVITIDKNALMQGLNGHRDVRVVANAASKDGSWQLDHPEEAWIHIEEARREIFEPERERDMLPGEGDNLDWIRLEIRNTEYPDGQEFQFPVTNVVVTEGEEYLETVPTDDNDWHFDIKACGDIIFDLTFENEKGEVENYQVTRHATGDIYDVWQHRDGPSDNGLPGTSIELWADGVHRYITENGEHRENWQSPDTGWR